MKKFLTLANLLVLSGCSTYSTDFDCPKGDGLKCTSLHVVDQKVTRGDIQVVDNVLAKRPQRLEKIRSYGEREIIVYLPQRDEKIILGGRS